MIKKFPAIHEITKVRYRVDKSSPPNPITGYMNPGVPRNENMGSTREFHYTIKNDYLNNIIINFNSNNLNLEHILVRNWILEL
jgi:hypothetical protein